MFYRKFDQKNGFLALGVFNVSLFCAIFVSLPTSSRLQMLFCRPVEIQ